MSRWATAGHRPNEFVREWPVEASSSRSSGISTDPFSRYSQTFMRGKRMTILQQGSRREMLNLERFIVERDPGPLNSSVGLGDTRTTFPAADDGRGKYRPRTMRIWRFTSPDDHRYASAGRRGTWTGATAGVCPECSSSRQTRAKPLILVWEPRLRARRRLRLAGVR